MTVNVLNFKNNFLILSLLKKNIFKKNVQHKTCQEIVKNSTFIPVFPLTPDFLLIN